MFRQAICIIVSSAALLCVSGNPVSSAEAPDSRWFSQNTESNGYVRTIVNAVQPLDAPGNPYDGMYSDWDRWVFDNFQPGFAITQVGEQFEYPYDPEPDETGMVRQWMDFKVDEDGYLVPWSHWLESWTDDTMRYGSGEGQLGTDLATGFAIGMVDAGLYAEWKLAIEEARDDNRASGFPPIPAWLMQQDPLSVVFVPNGDICVKGPFGIVEPGMDHQAIMDLKAAERWYRYSPQGELLESGRIYPAGISSHAWMCFYWPELPGKISEMQDMGYVPHYGASTVRFQKSNSRTMQHEAEIYFDAPKWVKPSPDDIIAIYNYDGSEMEEEADAGDLRKLISMDWPALGDYHRAQLSRGVVSATSVSPFEGLPTGPQRISGEYRPPVAVRPPNQDLRSPLPLLEVRPLDDPVNPWQEQYSQWDVLCFQNAGIRNVQLTGLFDQKRRALEQSVDEAKAAGQTLEEYMQENPKISTGVDEAEMLEKHIVHLSNAVDDNGFLVPAELTLADMRGGDYAQYITAYVTLPDEEMLDSFQEWQAGLKQLRATAGN